MKFIEKMFLYWHLLLLHCNNSYITLKSTEWFYFGSQMSWKWCLPISTSFKLILWTIGVFKVRDAVVFGRVLLHVKASKQTHLEKMSIVNMNINWRNWVLLIHIFDCFWWSRYCKDMAGNFFQKEAKAKCWILPSLSKNGISWISCRIQGYHPPNANPWTKK